MNHQTLKHLLSFVLCLIILQPLSAKDYYPEHLEKCFEARDHLEELKEFELSGINDKGEQDCLVSITFKNEKQKNKFIQARKAKKLSPYKIEFKDNKGKKQTVEIKFNLGESCDHSSDSSK